MKLQGHVLSFNEWNLWGTVGYDLEVLKFHSTSFHAPRRPVVGEVVEIVLNQDFDLLAVFPYDT